MKKLFLLILLFLITSQSAQAAYCTDRNWDKALELLSKYRGRYDDNVDRYNERIKPYNEFEFVSGRIYTTVINDLDFYDLLKDNGQKAAIEAEKFNSLKKQVKVTIKGLKNARDVWKKLADYCYDEDFYEDYKLGRSNMRLSADALKDAEDLRKDIDRLREKYVKEVEFISHLKLSDEARVLKGQALTCDEARDKTKRVEIKSNGSTIVYENFLVAKHHSKIDHSLNIKKEPIARTLFFDTRKGDADDVKNINAKISTFTVLIKTMEEVIKGSRNRLFAEGRDGEILASWSKSNRTALPIELTKEKMAVGLAITPSEAQIIQKQAIQARLQVTELRKLFAVQVNSDKKQGKSISIAFNDICDEVDKAGKIVAPVNGKEVAFTLTCWEPELTGDSYRIATPSNKKGMNYLVSEFKKKTWVTVVLESQNKQHEVQFWANGFTRSWNAL
ncbi:hypothetical protein MD588_23290 [Photobacterium sp. SDRW27]|uniref:hypothetical protein n=1 Tax=Photobacterium obscurum TaxID=2829490 RepID=UPI002244E24D|nr:hypothetical protein [Photobacterium obscurum]MCW8331729.1 hypothetical protein [Photobacterium obscurum]